MSGGDSRGYCADSYAAIALSICHRETRIGWCRLYVLTLSLYDAQDNAFRPIATEMGLATQTRIDFFYSNFA